MPSCRSFVVKVRDVAKAVKQVRDEVKDAGGTFNGDETKGTYKVSDSHWMAGKFTIEGSYSVADNNITINNSVTADNPKMVTCEEVEKKIRDWLK